MARWVVLVVATVVSVSVLAGCTSARSNLGTSDSSCYLALPSAAKAVGSNSRLVGVHRYTSKALAQRSRAFAKVMAVDHNPPSRLCVIEYTGSFTAASVAKPEGRPRGRLAVVVLGEPSNRLIGTFVFRRAVPLPLGHAHFG